MVGLLSRQRRRAPRPSLGRGFAVLHGRALHLPPAALAGRTYPAGHAIAAGLGPFRVRLYLQRATVTVMRALALAALAAIAILLVRLSGIGMPPLVPLLGAGVVVVAALCSILWQRPSTPQMAHALDQRLGLREQIGSALELEPSSSRLAALLYQRTTAAIESANPAYILPWPSLRRERRSLIVLGLVAGLCALLAAHAPLPRQFAAAPTARPAAERVARSARRPSRAPGGRTGSGWAGPWPRAVGERAEPACGSGGTGKGSHARGARKPGRGEPARAGQSGRRRGSGLHTAPGVRQELRRRWRGQPTAAGACGLAEQYFSCPGLARPTGRIHEHWTGCAPKRPGPIS